MSQDVLRYGPPGTSRRHSHPLDTIQEYRPSHMSSYSRNLSPGSRRLVNPTRASDSNVDAYLSQRHNSYVSPRTSGERVIPISQQTFVNIPSSSSGASRTSAYDPYSGRPRRSSLLDPGRGSKRPNVIQEVDSKRTSSPPRNREYYVVPASSKEPKKEHRKVYSIDEGGAKLVDDSKHHHGHRRHRRHDSEDQSYDDRARRGYPKTRKDKSIDDDDAFSYTDAAGMFRETQPSWRERETRPRRGSLDRSGASRERPVSMLDPYGDPRKSREGPPPSQRGWDKINEGLGRTRSVRDGPREVPHSPSRGHERRNSFDRSRPTHDYDSLDEYDYDQRQSKYDRAPRRQDRSVSRRGFGIRSDSQGATRRSDESLDNGRRNTARDPYVDRRDYASDAEKKDSHHRRQNESRHDRYSDEYDDDRQDRRRDDRHKQRDRDYDDREQRYRDDDRDRRHDRDSDEGQRNGVPGAAKLAAGGLGAAALYGLSKDKSDNDDRPRRETDRQKTAHKAPYPENDDQGLGFAFEGGDAIKRSKEADIPDEKDNEPAASAQMPDPDEEYRRRMQQMQRDLGIANPAPHEPDPERERRRRDREVRLQGREDRGHADATPGAYPAERSPVRSSFEENPAESSVASSRPSELRRKPSIIDQPMPAEPTAQIIDNSQSEKRENRVRIVDPPTEEEDRRPRGILKKPTVKFPEDHNSIREGVAPLKDVSISERHEYSADVSQATKKGIPPGARWTKIDRRLVNPEALEEAKERYEERLDCVIVLRVLTKEEIQKLADRTKELRDKRFDAERAARRRDRDRDRDRHDRDEYSDDGLEDWERDEKKPVRMLEAPPQENNSHNDRHRDREGSYVSSRSGRD